MIHEELAKVGDKTPTAMCINADHAVGHIRDAVRATRPRGQRVKGVADERNISHSLRIMSRHGGTRRWQVVDNGCAFSRRADL